MFGLMVDCLLKEINKEKAVKYSNGSHFFPRHFSYNLIIKAPWTSGAFVITVVSVLYERQLILCCSISVNTDV